jgi:magnesium transporter
MNFDTEHPANMPELRWSFGYPYALGLMLCITAGLLVYFRRKKWI